MEATFGSFFSVDQNLFHLFALHLDAAIVIDVYAGQFFQHIFHGGIGLRLERIGIVFQRIFFHNDRGHDTHDHRLLQHHDIGFQLNRTQFDSGLHPQQPHLFILRFIAEKSEMY